MIVCVTGMPASGKTKLCSVAEKIGYSCLRMGRVFVDEICKKYGIAPTDTQKIREYMTKIREMEGADVVAKTCAPKIKELLKKSRNVFIEGIRGPEEYEFLKKEFGKIKLISIWSSTKVRIMRMLGRKEKRGDVEKTEKEFLFRDKQEIKVGVPEAMIMADYLIANEKSYTSFCRYSRKILERLKE